MMIFISDNLSGSNIKQMMMNNMKAKKRTKSEEELEAEHEQAKEELHQAELERGYEQDEKFNESKD